MDADVELWQRMKANCGLPELYRRAWEGLFIPAENEVFWKFGAGIEFKVWCARQFLTELKAALAQVKR